MSEFGQVAMLCDRCGEGVKLEDAQSEEWVEDGERFLEWYCQGCHEKLFPGAWREE